MKLSPKDEIGLVLKNELPSRFIFAPNYWQWFAHHKNHGIFPEELKHCEYPA